LLHGVPIYVLPMRQARPFADALSARGLYQYSEPNLRVHRTAFPSDPLTPAQWALPSLGLSGVTPPGVTTDSPLLAV
jgi:hypothetical protein